jgi:hypothetical protein
MANEVTYAGLSGHFTTSYRLAVQNMIDALYERTNQVLPWLRRTSLAGQPTTVEKFPLPPKIAAAGLTDGTDLANTAFSPTSVNLTVAEVGLMLTLTDLARSSSISDYGFYGSEAGKAVAEKLIGDICALLSGFSTAGVNTTGVNLTEQGFRDTKTALITANVPGPYVAVLHPVQVNDLETSIGSTISAAANTGASARAETNDLSMGPDLNAGVLYGVSVIASPSVPTANAGADRAGGMFAANRALGYVEKWAIRPELERDASLRASEIVVTSAYAVGEIHDGSGRFITTDA